MPTASAIAACAVLLSIAALAEERLVTRP